MNSLRQKIERIDRRGYKSYKELYGSYKYSDFELHIDRVQCDPFANSSVVRIVIDKHNFSPEWLDSQIDSVALCDYLSRMLWLHCKKNSRQRGTGHSGEISVPDCGQIVLKRSTVEIFDKKIIARLFIGLPAKGRTIDGHSAYEMFFMDIPQIVRTSLFDYALKVEHLTDFIHFHRDQNALRKMLGERNLIAFIANDAILPRESGISQKPMKDAVPFRSPDDFMVEFELPSGRKIAGMGIPEGTTLIVGGGFHGKSTLLQAIQSGVYNHIPGDGREFVITRSDSVKVRSEDGRSVVGVDISPFISELPSKKNTSNFYTQDASGSISMAASISEALEAGAKILLFDEDTSATNFMIKDDRMIELIEREPIVPLVDRVKELREKFGVSVIIVVGGAGEYLDAADTVILMDNFLPRNATNKAKEIIKEYPSKRGKTPAPMNSPAERIVLPKNFSAAEGKRKRNIKVQGKVLIFGEQRIDLHFVEQIMLPTQIRAIGFAMAFLQKKLGHSKLSHLLDIIEKQIQEGGLSSLLDDDWEKTPDLAGFRKYELAATINRMQTLNIEQA